MVWAFPAAAILKQVFVRAQFHAGRSSISSSSFSEIDSISGSSTYGVSHLKRTQKGAARGAVFLSAMLIVALAMQSAHVSLTKKSAEKIQCALDLDTVFILLLINHFDGILSNVFDSTSITFLTILCIPILCISPPFPLLRLASNGRRPCSYGPTLLSCTRATRRPTTTWPACLSV